MTPDFSPFSYVFNNPVNVIDEFGLMGSGWNTRGREKTEAETANQEQMDNPTIKRVEITQNAGAMANIPDGGSKGWYQKAKAFVMSDGPAYKDMSSFRQGINDIGNSSFVRSISEWNPFNDGLNAFTGIITGKNLQGEKMSGASIALTAFMATPIGKAGKLLKVAKFGGKTGSTVANRLGQQMHKAYKADLADKVNRFKEFTLPSGKRIDFIDIQKGIIYELKPNNQRAISKGQKQLQMYMKELQNMPEYKGIQWKTVLDTY